MQPNSSRDAEDVWTYSGTGAKRRLKGGGLELSVYLYKLFLSLLQKGGYRAYTLNWNA
jgi:hypothetical protein